jgi:hypothetical protein
VLETSSMYIFRILALPQIYVFAIWLHREDENGEGPSDLLMPINPAPDTGPPPPPIWPMEPLIPYTEQAFLNRVKSFLPDAQQRCPKPEF